MNHDSIASRPLPSARFFGGWVLVNLLGGWLVGFLENNGFQFMATLFFSGAVIGSGQWLLLKRLGGFRWWPIASALGWILGVLLETGTRGLYQSVLEELGLALSNENFPLSVILSQSVWILGMAIAQALILRCRDRAAGVWIGVSLIGMATHSVISLNFCASFCGALPAWSSGLASGVGWAAYGVVTGLAIIKLWGHSPNSEQS